MATPKRKKSIKKVFKVKNQSCYFCRNGVSPDYKNYADLARFLSDRARILGRDRTGVCAKHQRAVAREVKRARHLALLPFVVKI